MKYIFWKSRILVLALACTGVEAAFATLAPNLPRGEKIIQHPVANRHPEVCVIPKHFASGEYADKDAESEQDLCAYDEFSNVAVCPKLNSTNPGLDFYSVPSASTPAKIQAADCKQADAKKVAKYKLSTSCSYTPSILAYYHLSRILGGIAEVPPAVLRTFDVQNHISLGRKALAKTAPDTLIHKTWSSLLNELSAGAKSTKRDLLLSTDFTQSYGALSVNPKKEAFYKEFFNAGASNVARAENFRDKNPVMALLAKDSAISKLVAREFSAENVQKMVQLKDAADMIVLDTLLNQQDRFGNMHFIDNYYFLDAKQEAEDGVAQLKSDKKLSSEAAVQLGAVQVKQLMLKDNDCGVAKQNIAKQAGLAQRIAHIDPNTYRRLLQFEAVADAAETQQFFEQGLMFTAKDYAGLRANLKDLVSTLHSACVSGRLRLDLDLPLHFSIKVLEAQQCDL